MKTLKKIGLACAFGLIGLSTAATAQITTTITFSGVTGTSPVTLTDDNDNTTWTVLGAQKVEWDATANVVKFSFGNGTGQTESSITGVIPNTWLVTAVEFGGGTPNTSLTHELTVNGVKFSASSTGTSLSFVGSTITPGGPVMLRTTGGTTGSTLTFKTVKITYTVVSAAPVLTYTDSREAGNNESAPYAYTTMPTGLNIYSDQPLYVGGSLIDNVAVANIVELWDMETSDIVVAGAVTTTIVADGGKKLQLTYDQSKLKHCRTYTVVVGIMYNADGTQVATNSQQWYFSTPTLTAADFAITGTFAFTQGDVFDRSDWVIKYNGTDVTAQCSDFSNPDMTTAGTKNVTFVYDGCTITQPITVAARSTYTLTWRNEVTNEADVVTTAQAGIAVGTLPQPAQTKVTTDCGEKRFIGWSMTSISGYQDEAPALITTASIPTANRTLYAVYADASGGTGNTWEKVTAESQLQAGSYYLIGNTDGNKVMGEKTTKNFKTVDAAVNADGTITPAGGYTAVKLGGAAGAWTLQTDDDQYLYAVSSSQNYLQTRQENSDGNSQWTIAISSGNATIKAQGSNKRNIIQYNPNTSSNLLFSCYSGGQSPISLYANMGGGMGFITKCSCTPLVKPTGLVSSAVAGTTATLSWTAVAGATSYLVEYSSNGTAWNKVECTTNSYKVSGLSLTTSYRWRITAMSSGEYCVKSDVSAEAAFTTTSNCAWQIDYQPTSGGTWNTGNCFTQVESGHEWQLADFTLPTGDCQFWVGPGTSGGHSKTVTFSGNLTFAALQNTSCSKPYPGENAVGTLRIFDDSGADNYFVGFMPTYQIAYGLEGGTWTHLPFAYVGSTTYETALTEVPSGYWGNNNYKFYVGAKNNANGTNWISGKSNTVAMQTMGGLKTEDISGVKGVYRIFDNSCDENWFCAFVPYYNIVYYAADNTTVFHVSDYKASDATDRSITIITTYPPKDGYRFDGWSDKPNGSKIVDMGESYTLKKCNEPFYPVYVQQVTLGYNGNSGNTTCESSTYDINTVTTVCTDEPVRSGYKFIGWNTIPDGSGTAYTGGDDITLTANTILYAQWLPYINLRYDKTNVTFASGCDVSDSQVVKGDVITLCAEPTSTLGYTFKHWCVNGECNYAAGSTYTVTGTETDILISIEWDIPARTFEFINQGAGTTQETVIATAMATEGSFVTAPTSCGSVPANCDGKLFVGWLRGTYDGQLDGTTGVNSVEQLIEKAKEQAGGDADIYFVEPGGRIKVADSATERPNWGKWYAVFAIPE